MDLTMQLPEEVADMIFCLLPIKDLLSCSLVSSQWRDAVNKNRMWKRFCKLESNLEDVECTVSPRFALPPSDEDLAPLCKYRHIYMRENHLRQNVINNRWSKHELMRGQGLLFEFEFLGKFMISTRHPLELDSRSMIVVLDMENDMQEVDRTECLLDRSISLLEVFGSYIVVIQDDLLQMFSVVEGRLTLSLCKIIVLDEAVSLTMPVIDITSSSSRNEWKVWYNKQQTCSSCHSSLANKYCVTVSTSQNSNTLHFWEIESGSKIKTTTVPGPDNQSYDFKIQTHVRGDKINIILRMHGFNDDYSYDFLMSNSIKVMSFRLESLGTIDFCADIPNSYRAYFVGAYVVIFPCEEDSTEYKIVDTTKGGAVLTRQVAHNISAVDIHGAQVAFASGNNVHVLHTDTMQETVLTIFAEGHGSITHLHFINSEFFQLSVDGELIFNTEIWDLKSGCNLNTLSHTKGGLVPFQLAIPKKSLFPKIYFRAFADMIYWSLNVISYW